MVLGIPFGRNKGIMGSEKTNRLITEVDIGPTHDAFAVWLYSLDCGPGTGKDADELSVVGHCRCTKNCQNDALELEKKYCASFWPRTWASTRSCGQHFTFDTYPQVWGHV